MELAKAEVPPSRISKAGALRSFRRLMRDYLHLAVRGQTLCVMLHRSLIDTYERKSKASRDYPRKKKHEATGVPTITEATSQQIKQARMLKLLHRGQRRCVPPGAPATLPEVTRRCWLEQQRRPASSAGDAVRLFASAIPRLIAR